MDGNDGTTSGIPSGDYVIRKNPITPIFTIGFQKPGISEDFWFLETQIPGFWNPMVKKSVIGFFSDHKSRSVGSILVSPNRHGSSREQIIPSETVRTCKLMFMTGSKKYIPVVTKPNPVWDSILFQKPGICTDSWFLESNG
jgi:hypothetical protein